jgi:hypothetical protein
MDMAKMPAENLTTWMLAGTAVWHGLWLWLASEQLRHRFCSCMKT